MNPAIILLASGRGTRLGGTIPKVYLPVGGVPILVRTMRRMREVSADAPVILAAHPEDRGTHLAPLLPELEGLGLTEVVDGGRTRQESMQRALAACPSDRDLIVVHDAVRPFFPVKATRLLLNRAFEVGAGLLAVPAPDTLKRADADFRVQETVPRDGVWLAQTPQAIRRDVLDGAMQRAADEGFEATDDVGLVEHFGGAVEVVPGNPRNIKITIPADLELAEALAAKEDA